MPRRLLVVTPFLPRRGATHGGGALLAALLEGLAPLADVTLLSLALREDHAHEGSVRGLARRLLLVPHRRNADFSRTGLFGNRLRLAWRVGVRGLPLLPAKFHSPALARALVAHLEQERPDAVLLEYGLTAQYLPLCAGRPAILTDHEAGAESAGTSPFPSIDGRLRRAYVRRFYPRATLLQTLTPEDADLLREQLRPGAPAVEVRPPAVLLPARACRPDAAGEAVAFFGNFAHRPNREATRFLVLELLPRLRARRPTCELLVAGEGAPPEVAALGRVEGVRFEGYAPDLGAFLGRARCVLAPLFSGAGVRIKVLEAMAHGLPVVANALGARGLADAPDRCLRRAEGADAIAEAALAFLADPGAAQGAGEEARRWVGGRASPRTVAELQLERVERLLGSLRSRGG
ncbi:MAG TPA: glycosyltransferase [Planctomycetota bacterium]|nr:glycosyltransferase [Planctomycetota bacterium]